MATSELSARSAGPDAVDDVRDLHDEVVALARDLPGGLRRLTVRDGDRAVEVEWATGPAEAPAAAVVPVAAVVPAPVAAGPAETEGTAVRSPLVGTFYTAPSPGADPFVRVGDEVEPGQTVGIVEAMKLMNPIVVDEAGVVADVLVGDAESVEYDQVLLVLRPAGGPR
ncbi:acetyl-CoA carboxylase biotin carboxyl carrier protein [Geodermatophilus telluris]|uniref:Biotin carboxyl carrier protein of acetyl-CoA carboxylase n=1 Tax=Geodermatophilus telluris TaxID=1190417 RepID=A0A1G6UIP0_9ACTN|nr:acetyl-CoA carboxylase biotin carboxyl carrier protein [Geodermatophilus telluris]SDD41131.1 acetyl-CoA carboxylase biotin carboxyl carrier protein [Geodermatophilus telluris]